MGAGARNRTHRGPIARVGRRAGVKIASVGMKIARVEVTVARAQGVRTRDARGQGDTENVFSRRPKIKCLLKRVSPHPFLEIHLETPYSTKLYDRILPQKTKMPNLHIAVLDSAIGVVSLRSRSKN